jgi:hypothetical protein
VSLDQGAAERALSGWDELRPGARRLSSGLWAGLISGAVIGGVGGRLAMFILRLTSDPSVIGMESDDGFTIGEFTPDTVFLIVLGAVAGALGGLLYLLVRAWLPQSYRPLAYGLLGAAVGGSLVVHPDGIDFVVLEPLWLAIAMFVALPGVYGATTSLLAERFLEKLEVHTTYGWVAAFLPILALALLGSVGLLLLLVVAAGWAMNRRLPLVDWWHSRPVTWFGRLALLAVFGLALVTLIADSVEIL